jgi:uncharacterized repeat protein (TIGR01451 family)
LKKLLAVIIILNLAFTEIVLAQGVCVKPNAGNDQALSCSSNFAITTAALAATAVSGGEWSQASSNPSGAVIANTNMANTGISGLTPGEYNFIWSTSPTCSDTVMVTVPNCAEYTDLALKKSINKNIAELGDDLIYTIKVYNQSTVAGTGIEVTDTLASTIQFVPATLFYGQYLVLQLIMLLMVIRLL